MTVLSTVLAALFSPSLLKLKMDVVDAENSYVESFRFKQISGNDSKADSAKIQFRKSMGALASPMPASSSPLKDLSQLALLTNQFKFDGLDPSKGTGFPIN